MILHKYKQILNRDISRINLLSTSTCAVPFYLFTSVFYSFHISLCILTPALEDQLHNPNSCQAVVAHAFYPSTWEAEAGRFLCLRPACFQSEFQDSQGYSEKPCLENKAKQNKQTNKKQTLKNPCLFPPVA